MGTKLFICSDLELVINYNRNNIIKKIAITTDIELKNSIWILLLLFDFVLQLKLVLNVNAMIQNYKEVQEVPPKQTFYLMIYKQ